MTEKAKTKYLEVINFSLRLSSFSRAIGICIFCCSIDIVRQIGHVDWMIFMVQHGIYGSALPVKLKSQVHGSDTTTHPLGRIEPKLVK
jgi:hypothetical protein